MNFPKALLGDLNSLKTINYRLATYLENFDQFSLAESLKSCIKDLTTIFDHLEGKIKRYSGIRSELAAIQELQKEISEKIALFGGSLRNHDM